MSQLLFKRWSRMVTTSFRTANCGKGLQLSVFAFSTTSAEHDSPGRTSPPPIRVGFTESAGRGVFATRAIGAGDLIHTAKPFLTHPSPSAIHTVCYFCLRKLRNSSNQEDAGVSFCSEECKERSKLEEGFTVLRNAFSKTLIADEYFAFLSKQWYVSVLARIRINAFRVELAGGLYEDLLSSAVASIEAEAAVGNAVYILPSFYNHDCDPNAHIMWIDNADAKLKALRNVEEGEELRICYIDSSLDRDARRERLLRGFGFQCNCNRCLQGD